MMSTERESPKDQNPAKTGTGTRKRSAKVTDRWTVMEAEERMIR